MRPVVFTERRKAEYDPDKNRLNLKFLFPKTNGEKGIAGQIIFINGDVPQILVDAPEPVEVKVEARKGEGHR